MAVEAVVTVGADTEEAADTTVAEADIRTVVEGSDVVEVEASDVDTGGGVMPNCSTSMSPRRCRSIRARGVILLQ